LPFFVGDPALVGVGSAFVAGDGEDFGEFLIGYIIYILSAVGVRGTKKGEEERGIRTGHTDGQRILVVSVADLVTVVLGMRALVDQALCVVYVTVTCSASRRGGIAGVAKVEKNEARAACRVTRTSTDNVSEVGVWISDHVMRTSVGQVAVVAGEVGLWVESHWALLVVDSRELWEYHS
jgi:hypothetical protein